MVRSYSQNNRITLKGAMEVKVSLTLTVLNNDSIFPSRRVITLCPKNPSIVVGRASRNPNKALYCATDNAWLDSPVISRDHAIITLDSKRQSLTLQDTDSMHGTRLNDLQMTSHTPANLYNGDNVTFGAEVKRGSKIFEACTLQVNFKFSPYMETSNFELSESSDSDNRFSQSENEENDISDFISRIGRGFTKDSLHERLKAISATQSSGATIYSNSRKNFYGNINQRSQLEPRQKNKCSVEIKKHGIQAGSSICDIKSCTNSSAIIRGKNDCQFSSDSFPQYLGDINTGIYNSGMFELPNTLDFRNKDISIVPFSHTNNIDNNLDAKAYLDRSAETRKTIGTKSSNEPKSLICYHNSRYNLSSNSIDDDLVPYHQISPLAGSYKHGDKPHLNRTLHEYSQSPSVLSSNSMTSSPSSITLLASSPAEYFSPSSWEESSFSHNVPFFRAANRHINISKIGVGCVEDSNKRWSRILDDGIDKSLYFKAREFNKAHFHSMTCPENCAPFQQVQPGVYQQDQNSGNLQASCKGYNYVSLAPTLYGDDKKSSEIDNSITDRYLSHDKSKDSKFWNSQRSTSPFMNNIKSCQTQPKSSAALPTKDTQAMNVLEINETSDLVSIRQSDGKKRKFCAISGDSNREQEMCSQAEELLRESDGNSNKVSESLKIPVKADGRPKKRQRYLERFGYAALGGFAAAAGLFSLLVTTAPEFS